jgi:hypothetical protein
MEKTKGFAHQQTVATSAGKIAPLRGEANRLNKGMNL